MGYLLRIHNVTGCSKDIKVASVVQEDTMRKLQYYACHFVLVWLSFGVAAKASTKSKTYHFEPEVVLLEGLPEEKTFPGPPNYESLKKGDTPETGWYLKLSKKINVLNNIDQNLANRTNDDVKEVDFVQLVIDWTSPKKQEIKKLLIQRKAILVKGTLFSRLTGHHHAPVLINVSEIRLKSSD